MVPFLAFKTLFSLRRTRLRELVKSFTFRLFLRPSVDFAALIASNRAAFENLAVWLSAILEFRIVLM